MTDEHGAGPGTPDTLAFLFSDIEGSTRLEQAVGTVTYGAIRERHRELLRTAFAAHDGREQSTEGDSFFVAFPTASDALGAALDAQRAVAAEAWPAGGSVRVRMGLHAGEASLVGGSLVGLAINRAARIAAVAHGGQVLVSAAVRALAGGGLPAGASLVDLGAHRLKDLREPEHLHQLAAPDLPGTFPPLATLDARPNNLPTQLTSFVGREAELATACGLLAANRLVTLTGPGGTGKTRLSLQVAAQAVDDFPDGVFFVPLETVRDPGLVASRIAGEIGIAETGGRSGRDVVVEWLTRKRVLLVLDNFEQVVEAGPLVADLLRTIPDLKVIATSRAPLHVSGEQEFPVPGLPTPPDPGQLSGYERALRGGGAIDPAVLSTYEAVRLFIARAVAVRPGFAVTNENAPAVAAICARLHGMPLAIELAAARVKLLSPEAILTRLEHQLNALAAGARDLPARQQTLRGAIAWSYDILDEPMRRLLDRLAVFAGGIDLEAAEAIAGPSDELGIDVLDGVVALADQSLLKSLDVDPPRFRMLDTIREFAIEMLDTRPDAAAVRERHTRWYLALVLDAAPRLAGADQRVLLERLETEHDNIRAALDRAAAAGDAASTIGMAFAMWRFWQKRGHLNEARRRLEAYAAEPWSRDDPALRARLMEALGGVMWWQADIVAMSSAYREAVELWRSIGDKAEIANALYNNSFAFAVRPNPRDDPRLADPDGIGLASLEEALRLFRELGDRRGQANVLWGLGNREYFIMGSGDSGEPRFREALELFRQEGDLTMEAWSLHMLGSALLHLERPDESRPLLRHALRHFHDASDAAGISLVLDDLHSQAVSDDDLPRAARLHGAGRRVATTTGTGLAGFVDEHFEYRFRAHISGRLAPDELARFEAEGAAMGLDEAVAYALDVPITDLDTHTHGHA